MRQISFPSSYSRHGESMFHSSLVRTFFGSVFLGVFGSRPGSTSTPLGPLLLYFTFGILWYFVRGFLAEFLCGEVRWS